MNPLLILVNPRCQPLGHSTYLRARVEELHCIADDMRDPASKRMILQIADASEVMAKDAEFPGSATLRSQGADIPCHHGPVICSRTGRGAGRRCTKFLDQETTRIEARPKLTRLD